MGTFHPPRGRDRQRQGLSKPATAEQCSDARPDGRIYSQPGHESDRSVDSDLDGADAAHGLRLLTAVACAQGDRKSVVKGKGMYVRVNLSGRSRIKKKQRKE